MAGRWFSVGRVLRPHGIRGGIKIELLTDNEDRFVPGAVVWLKGEKKTVTSIKPLNNAVVITLNGIETPEQVDLYRNEYLQVPEEDLAVLPEGRFYTHEIVGMQVVKPGGEVWGTVKDTFSNVNTDMIEVAMSNGKTILIPLVAALVGTIDREKRTIVVDKDFFADAF